MKIKKYIDERNLLGVSGLFFACGSFGIVDGEAAYERETDGAITRYAYEDGKIRLVAEFTEEKNGVVVRKDSLTNITGEPITVNSLRSRFCLPGNEYEAYTQYSGWQHENKGGWQPLLTQVKTGSCGIRTCDGATPMLGLHNLATGKNTAFHLLPNAQWEMTVKKFPVSDKELVVLETGFEETGLRLLVAPNESIALPTVIFFEAESKVDLDAYKLHAYYNEKYPRRQLPVVYNSWLYCFDVLDIDALKRQADCAAEMGFEAFMIDAGWFGEGTDWFICVGDWTENMQAGPKGRLLELSEYIREKGMVFGLWFEPERAFRTSKAVQAHPEYFINETFLDFANEEARKYILKTVSEQIDRYGIGWVKFDFNVTIPYDPSGNAFYRYMQGQRLFMEALKKKYSDMYFTNCASGGARMELEQGTMFDSFWPSDNQGPCEVVRIVKDALKRMPTGLIDRWNVQKYSEGFPVYGKPPKGRMIHCNDEIWGTVMGVNDAYSEAIMQGGPFGFSCDIDGFSDEYKARWKEQIQAFKEKRKFFKDAQAYILIDREDITAIEYADEGFNECYIQVFTNATRAMDILFYPRVDENASYRNGDEVVLGKELRENGITIERVKTYYAYTVRLQKE